LVPFRDAKMQKRPSSTLKVSLSACLLFTRVFWSFVSYCVIKSINTETKSIFRKISAQWFRCGKFTIYCNRTITVFCDGFPGRGCGGIFCGFDGAGKACSVSCNLRNYNFGYWYTRRCYVVGHTAGMGTSLNSTDCAATGSCRGCSRAFGYGQKWKIVNPNQSPRKLVF